MVKRAFLSLLPALAGALAAANDTGNAFNLKSFKINLSPQFARLKGIVANTRLPARELYAGNGQSKGVPLAALRGWKDQWTRTYDWEAEQDKLNSFNHFTAQIEGLTIHFIHQKSKEKDAVPLILLHGWPGSFQEFLPTITPLTQKSGSSGVAFNVIVPSLPGFVFSSPAPSQNWTIVDTARVFNTLMKDVLGYKKYAVHGTDWGSGVGYAMYTAFNDGTILGGSFNFLPFFPPVRADIAANNITLAASQETTLSRSEDWSTTGMDYLNMLTHKPDDLGYTLFDNPVGQLAFIGGKFLLWSQPPPSPLFNTAGNSTLLTAISLYALTDSVDSSGWIYAANPGGFKSEYIYPGPGSVKDAAPMVFSSFQYNLALWPEEYVRKVGKLVAYRIHESGGHFAGLDNPSGLVDDLRELATFF